MLRRGLLLVCLSGLLFGQSLKKLAPSRWNLFSPQQDVELGKEAAAEIEKQVAVVDNQPLTDYVARIGKRLTSQPEAGDYPYTFKVIYDKSINAFALPGGPAFVHTGLILAGDNEAQIAGVLAHEISHVALRHGTSQVTKAQAANVFLGLGGALLGGSGSMLGQLAQMGVGLGANSLLLKFSRTSESEADLLGTRIMAKAGYDPVEMARFFEKLEAQEKGGAGSIPQFLSDHPSPGNRVRAVSDEVKKLPKAQYTKGDSAELKRMQKVIEGLPVPPKAGTNFRANDPSAARPSSKLKAYTGRGVAFRYPENWQVTSNQQSGELTIAAPEGIAGANGANEIAYGAIAGIRQASGQVEIERDTQTFLKGVLEGNRNMKASGQAPTRLTVAGSPAQLNLMYNSSAFEGQREVDAILTAVHPQGLFYLILIAPESEYSKAQPVFDDIIRSINFSR